MLTKLTGHELAQLHHALLSAYSSYASLAQMVFFECGVSLRDITPEQEPIGAVVFNLIVRAQADGWIDRLVAGAQRDRPNNPELAALAAPPSAVESGAAPVEAILLPGGRPFLNRQGLRWALRELLRTDGSRVLVVNGPPGSGKSYSLALVRYLAAVLNFPVAWVDLQAEVWPGYTPADLASALGRQMGADPGSMPTVQGSPGRWVHQLGDWLTAEAAREDGRWWFVLDGADQTDLPRETHDLIQYLAHQVAAAAFSLRLVLLGYEEPLPLGIEERVLRDNIGPIGQADLWHFFARLFAQEGLEYAPEAVEAAVDAVLQAVPESHPERPLLLSRAVTQAVSLLLPEGRR